MYFGFMRAVLVKILEEEKVDNVVNLWLLYSIADIIILSYTMNQNIYLIDERVRLPPKGKHIEYKVINIYSNIFTRILIQNMNKRKIIFSKVNRFVSAAIFNWTWGNCWLKISSN